MNKWTRIALSVLIVAASGAAVMVFSGRPAMQIGSVVLTIALVASIWMVSNLEIGESMKSSNHPSKIDKETKTLIEVIYKNFNAKGVDEISRQTQGFIVAAMRRIKEGSIPDEKNLMKLLNPIPASQFARAKDIKYLAATIASYYFRADDDSDFGFKTKTRVNNFIAGVNDTTL